MNDVLLLAACLCFAIYYALIMLAIMWNSRCKCDTIYFIFLARLPFKRRPLIHLLGLRRWMKIIKPIPSLSKKNLQAIQSENWKKNQWKYSRINIFINKYSSNNSSYMENIYSENIFYQKANRHTFWHIQIVQRVQTKIWGRFLPFTINAMCIPTGIWKR